LEKRPFQQSPCPGRLEYKISLPRLAKHLRGSLLFPRYCTFLSSFSPQVKPLTRTAPGGVVLLTLGCAGCLLSLLSLQQRGCERPPVKPPRLFHPPLPPTRPVQGRYCGAGALETSLDPLPPLFMPSDTVFWTRSFLNQAFKPPYDGLSRFQSHPKIEGGDNGFKK